MPSLYGASALTQSLRPNSRGSQGRGLCKDESMAANFFRHEARPEDFKTRFLEPNKVSRTIGVAPVHGRAVPIVFDASPGAGSHGRQQIAIGSEPAEDAPEDRRLLFERDVDDRKEGDDSGKAVGRKIDASHIG